MAAVRRYDILDTPPDGAFDRVTAIASRRFQVPISIISIVDEDRIWFKSHHGLDGVSEIAREPGLCASAILTSDAYILTDASLDPRSLANPLVAGAFGLRFYAAVPLTTHDNHNLGTLCVIDHEPRTVDQAQIEDLKDLASMVVDQLELRLAARVALARAELMAREIDHRVKNSLQFVSSLLSMQSREAGGAGGEQLMAAANRVASVARVHQNFVNEGGDVSCIDFLRRLCSDLSAILNRQIDVSGDPGTVPSTQIQPIGLLANELVTNAAKYSSGTIRVAFNRDDLTQELSVSDEGDALPPDFDPESSFTGLGMRVVVALARQLGGRLDVRRGEKATGAVMSVRFPIAPLH